MTTRYIIILSFIGLIASVPLLRQIEENCFLKDFEPKYATIPPYEDVEKTIAAPTVNIRIHSADTLGKVSKYIFGHAIAVWVSQDQNNPVLVSHLQKLSPTFIRFLGVFGLISIFGMGIAATCLA